MTKISVLPLLASALPDAYIPVVDPTEADPANQNKRILISTLTIGGANNTNIAPYIPGKYYNNDEPSYVSYADNIWVYINDTPAKDQIPATGSAYWELTSSSQFAHPQNTDTGTNSRTFEIGHLAGTILDPGTGSPLTEPTGSVTLIFGKANDDTNKVAIREFWETPGLERLYHLQFCLNYTNTGSDIWIPFANGEDVADLMTAMGTVQTDITTLQGAVTANATAITGKADKDLAINTQTANYTLVLTDSGGLLRMNVATANTVTIPPNSTAAFNVGAQLFISQAGAGQTTLVPGSGVTINSFGAKLKFAGQYAGVTLVKVATNTWNAYGNLTA